MWDTFPLEGGEEIFGGPRKIIIHQGGVLACFVRGLGCRAKSRLEGSETLGVSKVTIGPIQLSGLPPVQQEWSLGSHLWRDPPGPPLGADGGSLHQVSPASLRGQLREKDVFPSQPRPHLPKPPLLCLLKDVEETPRPVCSLRGRRGSFPGSGALSPHPASSPPSAAPSLSSKRTYRVLLGKQNLKESEAGEVAVAVEKAIVHEKWNSLLIM